MTRRVGCQWRRAVFYLRGQYWIVIDHLKAKAPTQITASWLFHPDCTLERDEACFCTVDTGQSNLGTVCASSLPVEAEVNKGQREPQMRGWYSERYNRIEACCQVEYHAWVDGSAAIAWVLYPLAQDVAPNREALPAARISQDDLTVRVLVTLPHGRGDDLAVVELGGKGRVDVDADTRVEGPCALFERRPEGTRLVGRPLDTTSVKN